MRCRVEQATPHVSNKKEYGPDAVCGGQPHMRGKLAIWVLVVLGVADAVVDGVVAVLGGWWWVAGGWWRRCVVG